MHKPKPICTAELLQKALAELGEGADIGDAVLLCAKWYRESPDREVEARAAHRQSVLAHRADRNSAKFEAEQRDREIRLREESSGNFPLTDVQKLEIWARQEAMDP